MMTTTTTTTTITTTLLATLAALTAGCMRMGGDGSPGRTPGLADAGTADACDQPTIKTMDITVTGSTISMKAADMPSGCWELRGKLTVSGASTSLAGLGDLRQVDDLVLSNSMVTKIDTAVPLAVTRTLDVENNTVLTSLANVALPNDASCLTYLAAITVTGNQALTDLGGVSSAMCVQGLTDISNNVELTAVTLDSAARLEGGLKVTYNTRMTSLSFTQLSSAGSITVSNNDSLTTFGAINTSSILGDFTVDSNKNLTTMPVPTKVQSTSAPLVIGGALTISNNDSLTNLGDWIRIGRVLNTHLPLGLYSMTVKNNKSLNVCQAREMGCCVAHPDTAQISTGNLGNSCNNGSHSWCYAGNGCPYQYTGN